MDTQPQPTPHRPWHANPRVGLATIIGAVLVCLFVGALGPSATTVPLGKRDSLLPPWYLPSGLLRLPDMAAIAALWVAVIVGACGLAITLRAITAGWRPPPWPLIGLGSVLTIATSLVPPLTSADVLMYAAYGRLQVLGLDPYSITPADIFRRQFDPVLAEVERPWQDTPSVYGPIASFSQYLANVLGGENMHDIVFWLQTFGTLGFLGVAALAIWQVWPDATKRTRAIMFTLCNPLLLWAVIAGAHNEALAVLPALAALVLLRKHPFFAGVAIGIAGCVKVSMVFYGLAMAWAYRRRPWALAQMALGALIPLLLAYAWWQPQALLAASRNAGYASASAWLGQAWELARATPIATILQGILVVLSYSLMLSAIYLFSRAMPLDVVPRTTITDAHKDVLTSATRATLVMTTAWLITSSYTLAWYDLAVWAPLAWVAGTHAEWALIWRGMWISLAFVMGRAVEFSPLMRATNKVIVASSSVAQTILLAIMWGGAFLIVFPSSRRRLLGDDRDGWFARLYERWTRGRGPMPKVLLQKDRPRSDD